MLLQNWQARARERVRPTTGWGGELSGGAGAGCRGSLSGWRRRGRSESSETVERRSLLIGAPIAGQSGPGGWVEPAPGHDRAEPGADARVGGRLPGPGAPSTPSWRSRNRLGGRRARSQRHRRTGAHGPFIEGDGRRRRTRRQGSARSRRLAGSGPADARGRVKVAPGRLPGTGRATRASMACASMPTIRRSGDSAAQWVEAG